MNDSVSRRQFLTTCTAGVAAVAGIAGCSSLSSTPKSTIVVLNQTQERFRVLLQITDSNGRAAFNEAVPIVSDAMQAVEAELRPGEYRLRAVTEDDESTAHEDTGTWEITDSACSRYSTVALNSVNQGIAVRVTTGTCSSS